MNEETKLGHGASGWKARQEQSRLRRARNADHRAKVREVRRQHKLGMNIDTMKEAGDELESALDDALSPKPPADLPEGVTGNGVEIHTPGGGWYRVYVDGTEVTDGNVRKAQAEAIAEEHRNAAE